MSYRPTPGRTRPYRQGPRPATHFRRGRRAAGGDARLATLFWLAVLVTGSCALGCIALGLSSPAGVGGVGKSLRAEHLIPKLSIIRTSEPLGAGDSAPAEPEPSEQAPLDRETAEPATAPAMLPRVVENSPLPEEAPVLPRPTAEPPLAVAVLHTPLPAAPVVLPAASLLDSDPAIYLPRTEPTSGESPMIRTWKTLALASLLAVPTVTLAGGKAADDTKEILKKLAELRTKVDDLSKKVAEAPIGLTTQDLVGEIKKLEAGIGKKVDAVHSELAKKIADIQAAQLLQKTDAQAFKALQTKLDAVNEDVTKLQTAIGALQKQLTAASLTPPPLPTTSADKAALDAMNLRLGAIEKTLAALAGSEKRIALSPPAANGSGKVVLVNQYNTDLLFTVNSQSYRVEPNRTLQITDVPPGALTYEVFASGFGPMRKTTTLQANETLTVTAR